MPPVINKVTNPGEAAFVGESSQFNGLLGITTSEGHSGIAGVSDTGVGNGVYGRSKNANGVVGYSSATGHNGVSGVNEEGTGAGVYGRSKRAAGVYGESNELNGVLGVSKSNYHSGVAGVNEEGAGAGVYGRSRRAAGVYGESNEFNGVLGVSKSNGHSGVAGVHDEGDGYGVYGRSQNGEGVFGETQSTGHGGIVGLSRNPSSTLTGAGVYGESHGGGAGVYGKGRLAGFFEGDVEVTGDLRLVNADCAEDFNVSEAASIEPGTVMVVGEVDCLLPSRQAYDKRVAGVISGAGSYKPGIILDKQHSRSHRKPIALLGKVFCKVDANYGSIEVGDLLTTSATAGHAMKATDPMKAFGAVIGKALRPLKEGQGLIPILIALQ